MSMLSFYEVILQLLTSCYNKIKVTKSNEGRANETNKKEDAVNIFMGLED